MEKSKKVEEKVLSTPGSKRETTTCKYCGTVAIARTGSYKGVQRFWCKMCRRKFKSDDHLFYMKVPAVYIGRTLDMFYHGQKIHDIRVKKQ